MRSGKEGVVPAFSLSATPASPSRLPRHCERKRSNPERPLNTGLLRRFTPRNDESQERTWNADRRCSQPAVLLARPRLQQKAHAYRRPTAVLPWRLSLPRCNFRPCFRGLGLAPILSHPPSGGGTDAVFAGVTRLHLSHVQRAPRGLVCSARRLMPEAARERLATPPAGTALAPEPRCAFAAGPLTERESQIICN